MKKNLFILAVTAAALASCSNDVTTAVNKTLNAPQEITFRSTTDGMTRAADINGAADLKSIKVYAFQTGTTTTPYLNNVVFTGPGTYTSSTMHLWPDYNLDFYAWSAHSATNGDKSDQVSNSAYNSYLVTPSADAAEQVDFIYAYSTDVAGPNAVPLAFSHKESRILVKVKNSDSALKFEVTGWKLGYMVPNATFNGSAWTPTAASASSIFTSDFTSAPQTINYDASATTALTGSQIMIPQAITPASAYASSTADAAVNGAFIGIEFKAVNASNTEDVVQAKIWGIWPIPAITWAEGNQYTYVIDLADGGYYETNHNGDNTTLDKIFPGGFIKFATVTITDWVTDLNSNSTADDDISATM